MEKQLLWSDNKYNVGVLQLDDNRKMIFDIVKNLYNSLMNKEASQSIVGTALRLFYEQSEICFRLEELYMSKILFPYIEFHQYHHRAIRAKLQDLLSKFKHDSIELSLTEYEEIFDFLNQWILEHLFEEDSYLRYYIEFVKYAKSKKIDVLSIDLNLEKRKEDLDAEEVVMIETNQPLRDF